jgi:hypothetical protein
MSQPADRPSEGGGLGDYEQAFFLHIPKTAGQSFQRFLREDAGLGDVLRIPPDEGMFPALAKVGDYRVAHGHAPYPVTGAFRKPLFVMTFLRSPVERVVSAFEHVWRLEDTPENLTRQEWGIKTIGDLVGTDRASNVQTLLLGVDYDISPILEGFKSGELTAKRARKQVRIRNRGKRNRETLERAKERLEQIEFVGLTEAFNDSLRLFASAIKFDGPLPSYRRNAAPPKEREARKRRYDAAELEAVAGDNVLDLELYECAVELFTKRYEDAFGEPPEITGR